MGMTTDIVTEWVTVTTHHEVTHLFSVTKFLWINGRLSVNPRRVKNRQHLPMITLASVALITTWSETHLYIDKIEPPIMRPHLTRPTRHIPIHIEKFSNRLWRDFTSRVKCKNGCHKFLGEGDVGIIMNYNNQKI